MNNPTKYCLMGLAMILAFAITLRNPEIRVGMFVTLAWATFVWALFHFVINNKRK